MAAEGFSFAINPDPIKPGVRIAKAKYDTIREAILENLRAHGPLTFTQLGNLLEDQLQKDFGGSVMWYYTTVKLDMEASGEIRRLPKSKPQLVDLSDESQD